MQVVCNFAFASNDRWSFITDFWIDKGRVYGGKIYFDKDTLEIDSSQIVVWIKTEYSPEYRQFMDEIMKQIAMKNNATWKPTEETLKQKFVFDRKNRRYKIPTNEVFSDKWYEIEPEGIVEKYYNVIIEYAKQNGLI
jgi:hypothetical protein